MLTSLNFLKGRHATLAHRRITRRLAYVGGIVPAAFALLTVLATDADADFTRFSLSQRYLRNNEEIAQIIAIALQQFKSLSRSSDFNRCFQRAANSFGDA